MEAAGGSPAGTAAAAVKSAPDPMVLGTAAVLMLVFFLAGLHVAGALGLIGIVLMYLFSDRPLWDMLGQIAWNVNSSSSWWPFPCS